MYLTISDAQIAADAIADHLGVGNGINPFKKYQDRCNKRLSVLQDLIDGFWSNPLAFGYMTHFSNQKQREGIIDIFAGRIYADETDEIQGALKRVVAAAGAF